MYDWVATQTTTENGLTRLLPVPQCIHDTTDEDLSKTLCLLCTSRIKLKFKNTPQKCDDFDHPGAGIYRTNMKPKWRKDAPPLLPEWMGDPPKMLTMREKCDQMNAILERKQTTYLKAAELRKPERWCECLGCCIGTQAPKPPSKRICYDMNIFFTDWE